MWGAGRTAGRVAKGNRGVSRPLRNPVGAAPRLPPPLLSPCRPTTPQHLNTAPSCLNLPERFRQLTLSLRCHLLPLVPHALQPKGPPPPAAGASADDAKRAALREALAQKMKQNIMAQG